MHIGARPNALQVTNKVLTERNVFHALLTGFPRMVKSAAPAPVDISPPTTLPVSSSLASLVMPQMLTILSVWCALLVPSPSMERNAYLVSLLRTALLVLPLAGFARMDRKPTLAKPPVMYARREPSLRKEPKEPSALPVLTGTSVEKGQLSALLARLGKSLAPTTAHAFCVLPESSHHRMGPCARPVHQDTVVLVPIIAHLAQLDLDLPLTELRAKPAMQVPIHLMA